MKNGRSTAERQLRPGDFYGEVLNVSEGCGFVLTDARYEVGRRLPEHSHELAFFCLLVDGQYTEYYRRRTTAYTPFTVAFHPPGECHRVEVGGAGGYVFNVEVKPSLLMRLREYAPTPDTTSDTRGGDMAWLMARLFREYRWARDCSLLAAEGLVLEMLAAACRAGADERQLPPWMSRVVELLHAEFRQSLTVNDVAAAVGVHPVHLSKVFRKFQRQTVGEYVRGLRIRYACGQLRATDAPLADIALSAGFSDQSHFTRVFKRRTGSTPGDFREVFRKTA
jgi:AraC family transcriptional regulator